MSAVGGGGGNGGTGTGGQGPSGQEDDYCPDQVKVYSNEGDGENTEHLNSMDLHDIKTELERDAEKSETSKSVPDDSTPPAFNSDGANAIATTTTALPQASIRPVIHHPTATMVYTNGSFMLPPFAGQGYPVMRPVKLESDWKLPQPGSATVGGAGGAGGGGGQFSIPAYGYPAGFLPVDQSGLRQAYPFVIPSQYVAAQMPYHPQFTALGPPNATVQPNSGAMIAAQVKEKKPHIKKPLNAFMLFMKQKRADVIKECTLKESAAINQILGKMWHALDRNEQAKYYEMAREERAKHMQMYPGWSARDNYAVHKKKRKRKLKQVDSKGDDSQEEGHKEVCLDRDVTSPIATIITPSSATKISISPTKTTPTLVHATPTLVQTTPTLVQRTEEDDVDLNNRKCRARFGLDQQELWCGPCRRKKKCIRYSVGDDEEITSSELEDEQEVTNGGGVAGSITLSKAGTTHHHLHTDALPPSHLHHKLPVTLHTIPT